jgi:hypothetical protein
VRGRNHRGIQRCCASPVVQDPASERQREDRRRGHQATYTLRSPHLSLTLRYNPRTKALERPGHPNNPQITLPLHEITTLKASFTRPVITDNMAAETKGHEALNPIHPSLVSRLDPAFVELYNTHVANTPNKPIDLAVLRNVYSRLYAYGTAPAPAVAREWETFVPGWSKYPDDIKIRVYVPEGEKPKDGWPVHFDFHGGGELLPF